MSGRLAEQRGEIAALRPVYTEQGDCTEIILTTGSTWLETRAIRSVRRALARLYAIDLVAARQHYRKVLGQANGIPLPLSAQLILCPIKVRRPRCTGDSTFGYVSYQEVGAVESHHGGEYKSAVILKNGHKIPVLTGVACVQKQLALARFVKSHYLEAQGLGSEGGGNGYPFLTWKEFIVLESKMDLLLQKLRN